MTGFYHNHTRPTRLKIKTYCSFCGKPIWIRNSDLRYKRHYCDKACYNAHQKQLKKQRLIIELEER